jgi:hypothetical protein
MDGKNTEGCATALLLCTLCSQAWLTWCLRLYELVVAMWHMPLQRSGEVFQRSGDVLTIEVTCRTYGGCWGNAHAGSATYMHRIPAAAWLWGNCECWRLVRFLLPCSGGQGIRRSEKQEAGRTPHSSEEEEETEDGGAHMRRSWPVILESGMW